MAGVLEAEEPEEGWDPRYAVPEADAESLDLIQEIRKKERLLAEADMKLEKIKDTKLMMAEAMKGLDAELRSTETLIGVKKREEEVENDLAALASRQSGVLSRRVARMKTELKSIAERKENLENRVFQSSRKLEEFKEQMNWDQQAMEAFLQESERQADDTLALVKYSHQDDQRLKSLRLALERTALEVNHRRGAFEKALTENKCLQFALDKGTESLRKTYQETRQLSRPWEDAVEQRKQRDADMQQSALQLARANGAYREAFAALAELTRLFDTQRKNNKEVKRKIDVSKQEAIRLRRDLTEEETSLRGLQDEVGFCKGELHKAEASAKSLKSDISRMKTEIRDNRDKLGEQEALGAVLGEKLDVVTRTALSEEDRAAHMEQILKAEEQAVKELDVLLRDNSHELFLATQQLEALKAKEKELLSLVSNSKSTLSNEYSRYEKLDKILRRQKGTVVEQTSQIELLKAKLAVLQGNLSSDEKQALEVKISEVTRSLEEKKETANILHTALKESENAIRRLKKEVDKSEAQKGDLSSTVDQLMLRCSGKENDLTTLRLKKEESMVRCQILKTEVSRLSNLLNDKEDGMLSSEKRKLELQRAIREREDEITVQRETLRRQLNLSDQERQKLSMELSEKLRRIDIMKNRFEVTTASMSVPAEEEESAQAYIITKAALESEELRRRGDALDAQIRRTELENAALENGNLLFSHHNSHLRQAFGRVDESSPEFKDKLWLEDEAKAAEAMLRNKEKQVKELQKDLQDKSDTLETLVQEEQAEGGKVRDKQQPITKLKREISSQLEKIDRAAKQCSQLTRQIRAMKNTKAETFEEKDIMLKEWREFSRSFDRMLSDAMENHPDLQVVLERYFQQAGLSLPAPPSTPSSSRGSTAGSACSPASFRSTASSAGSSRGAADASRSVNMVDLALELPPTPLSSNCPDSAGSRSSRSSTKSRKMLP